MFSCFKVNLDDVINDLPYESNFGNLCLFEDNSDFDVDFKTDNFIRTFKKVISGKEIILGDDLQDEWFPEVEADIFISHAHNDDCKVIKFAHWLKNEFGLNAFIDSKVWGYADNLIDRLCNSLEADRQFITQHVYGMLSAALHNMIDKTESFIFLKSSNSIFNPGNGMEDTTLSPWLYLELEWVRTIRRNPSAQFLCHRHILHEAREGSMELIITHKVNTKRLINLTLKDLIDWHSEHQMNEQSALETLYEIKGII